MFTVNRANINQKIKFMLVFLLALKVFSLVVPTTVFIAKNVPKFNRNNLKFQHELQVPSKTRTFVQFLYKMLNWTPLMHTPFTSQERFKSLIFTIARVQRTQIDLYAVCFFFLNKQLKCIFSRHQHDTQTNGTSIYFTPLMFRIVNFIPRRFSRLIMI